MPKFNCVVHEEVKVTITVEVEAETKEGAAQIARDAWVNNGEGEKHEAVNERWVEIDRDLIETED